MNLPVAGRLRALMRLLWTLRRPGGQARLRSELWTRLRFGDGHFQGSTHTLEDRFPVLFRQTAFLLGLQAAPRVLSFGCSTGEEVFTLARYLPRAEITGVDLNRWCLAQARRRARKERPQRVQFLHARSPEFLAAEGFDAIFALAVFQRTENTHSEKAEGFRFGSFEAAVEMLDRKLKPGGLLFLDQCDFAFADTSVFPRYAVLPFQENERKRERALFRPDDAREGTSYSVARGYRKLG